MKITIKGKEKLFSQLENLPKTLNQAVYGATHEITEDVQGRIESKLSSSIKHASGELMGSFKSEVVEDHQGNIVGRNWSDNPVALFREMGTGKVGAESQKDLPEGINPTYMMEPWFFPADSVDVDLEAIYGMPKIEINGKEFYRTNGQPARPFIYPAFKEGMEHAEDIFKDHVQRNLRKGL